MKRCCRPGRDWCRFWSAGRRWRSSFTPRAESPGQAQTPATDPRAQAPAIGTDAIEGVWAFSAEAGEPGTGGQIGIFTFKDGRVTTDAGAGGEYEVTANPDGTVEVEVVLEGQSALDPATTLHTWFRMKLVDEQLYGEGEAETVEKSGEVDEAGRPVLERGFVVFDNEIVAARTTAGAAQ